MITKDLLFKLSDLESVLASYSFEELKVADAEQLKKLFEDFKYHVQEKISIGTTPTRIGHSINSKTSLVNHRDQLSDAFQVYGGVGMLLKESLNNFIGILSFLKDEVATRQQWDQVVEIQTTSTALLGKVDALLACSSHENELHASVEIEFDLYELVNNAKFLAENLIVHDELKIVAHYAADLPYAVIGDMTRVMHIVLDMLGKTLQYAKKGEIYLQVASKLSTHNTIFLEFQIDNFSCELIQTNHCNKMTTKNHDYYANEIIKLLIKDIGGSINIFKHGSEGTLFKFGIPFNKGRKK
ncbi:MAG: hypothetical protein MUO53_07235 [Maribacter sp.]|nr:hypothetical protein [Maribacter sp.]